MKSVIIFIAVLFTLSAQAQTVKVAAASDMKYLMPELVAGYKTKYPSAAIDVSFGSSGLFYQQISNGAAYDADLQDQRAVDHSIDQDIKNLSGY